MTVAATTELESINIMLIASSSVVAAAAIISI